MVTSLADLVVTTSRKARPETQETAEHFAEARSLPFVVRNDVPIEQILSSATAALVFTNGDVHVATREGRLSFHLGTAYIRLKSLQRGDGDPLVRAGQLLVGDHVLDTTFGLGRDAIVAARAVGPSGRVEAIESSPALFHLADLSLPSHRDPHSAEIQLAHGDARKILAAMDSASVDIVLVDPMFATPKTSDAGFALLRDLADYAALDQPWIRHARRVARRAVVLKSGEAAPWFADEQLERVHSHSNATWYRAPALAT